MPIHELCHQCLTKEGLIEIAVVVKAVRRASPEGCRPPSGRRGPNVKAGDSLFAVQNIVLCSQDCQNFIEKIAHAIESMMTTETPCEASS
jgi:hypothetical protein